MLLLLISKEVNAPISLMAFAIAAGPMTDIKNKDHDNGTHEQSLKSCTFWSARESAPRVRRATNLVAG
jgi:hypothetical protein